MYTSTIKKSHADAISNWQKEQQCQHTHTHTYIHTQARTHTHTHTHTGAYNSRVLTHYMVSYMADRQFGHLY